MASTDATPFPVKNQAYRVTFPILDADGDLVTGATGLDSEVSKDAGTFADCTNEATEIATSSGVYYLDLTATEMNADTVAIIVKTTSTGAKTTVLVLYPQADGLDRNVNVTHWNGTAVATPATAGYPAVTIKSGTGTGEVSLSSGTVTVGTNNDKTGYSLTATTGLGNQTANITGNLSGSVGSVTGAVGSVTGNVGGNVTGSVGSVLGGINTTAGTITTLDGLDTAQDTQHATTQTIANYGKYAGPRGPGVYLNDAAANTNTTFGTDGTINNPVSTIGAAKTIADANSLDRIYLVNDSSVTLAAAMTDYEFVGIGEVRANVVDLGGQDVANSAFYNLTIQGDGSAATARIYAEGCALQDPGAGTTTLHIFAERCGIVDDISLDTSADNVFDSCYSLVAGTSAPIIRATGAAGTVAVRHYSGGVQFEDLSASHNASVETDGQVIFAASCNVNATVVVRGNCTITDSTAGMNNLTQTAAVNMTKINNEMVDALATDTYAEPGQGAPAATTTLAAKINYLYKAWRNRSTQTATTYSLYADDGTTVDQKATVSDNTTTADKGEVVSGP